MENRFDTLAKTLAGGMTRREAMRRIGGGLAAAVLAPLVVGKAWGQNPNAAPNAFCEDLCKSCVPPPPEGEPPRNEYGQCVAACERCINLQNGIACTCEDVTGEVTCCIDGTVCIDEECVAPPL